MAVIREEGDRREQVEGKRDESPPAWLRPKVYLAARYSRIDELNGYKADLEALGYQVPARWLLGEHRMIDGQPGPQNEGFAKDDWRDIEQASVFVAFTEDPRTAASRGGRHVEFGIALTLREIRSRTLATPPDAGLVPDPDLPWPEIHVVGPKENVFYYLAACQHHESWGDALLALYPPGGAP